MANGMTTPPKQDLTCPSSAVSDHCNNSSGCLVTMTKGEQNGLTNDAHLVKVAPISSTFTWADVKYGVGTGKKEKQILKGVPGSLGGGKTCAIIGPSGAAKPRCSTCSPTASTTREALSVSRASFSSTTSPSVALRCASGLH
eukprot:scaffold45603_cov48-Phaeocystis_antarctica.AAC.1